MIVGEIAPPVLVTKGTKQLIYLTLNVEALHMRGLLSPTRLAFI